MPYFSEEYQQLLQDSHAMTPSWGRSSPKDKNFYKIVKWLEEEGITEFIDYGSSWGGLEERLEKEYPGKYRVVNYDPGIPEYCEIPNPAQAVVCTDVLEHIEPDCLDAVLYHLLTLSLEQKFFFVIGIGPAYHVLPDGRNAHLIQETPMWWKEKLKLFRDCNVYILYGNMPK